jgi:RND family efflux transporter MFP subunit
MKKWSTITVGLILVLGLAACSNQEAARTKSISEIHDQEGVPVTVRTAQTTEFATYLSYMASLRGVSESTASSMVSDVVAEILYEVGDYVEKDSPVVLFPSDNPALNYEQARLSYESARTAFNRIEKLYQDDGVSQQSYDDARTQFQLAKANWESVQKMIRVAAPISGYITRINVFESENVKPGASLFTVADFTRLNTVVWVTDSDIARVKVGQPAAATWQGIRLEGQVVQVDLAMDEDKMAFAVKLEFENPDRKVKSGVTGDITIQTYRETKAFIVHQSEVIENGGESFVYIAQNNQAELRKVSLGRRQGMYLEVLSGLRSGDRVITKGLNLLTPEKKIKIIEEAPRLVQK